MNPCPCQHDVANRDARVASLRNAIGGHIAAYKPPTLEERYRAAHQRWSEAQGESERRKRAASLAVKSSDGAAEDLSALALLFMECQNADSAAKLAWDNREALRTAMDAEKEAKSNG